MDLTGVSSFILMRERDDTERWTPGSAWLAGGTWLFSEPQTQIDTLLDLSSLSWPPVSLCAKGLTVSATCTFAELLAFQRPPDLVGLHLIEPCCAALLGSFKVWNVATVGGNICLALPAAPMVALAIALDAFGVVWMPGGFERRVPIVDLVVGPMQTTLAPNEILREIVFPSLALRRRSTSRRASLTSGGRSAALLIGTRGDHDFALTITAATRRPLRLAFTDAPTSDHLRDAIDEALPDDAYYDDIHGRPAWRRHMTRVLAEDIRAELMGS